MLFFTLEDIVLIEENVKPDIAWPIDDTENTEDMQESNDSKSSNTTEDEFNDESFHCADLLHMHFDSLDPSLALGFICKFEDDFNDLIVQLKVSSEISTLFYRCLGKSPSFVETGNF
jgi:hypothetical protein